MIKRIFSALLILITITVSFVYSGAVSAAEYTADDIAVMAADLEKKLAELDSLMNQCRERGISADYEIVNYATIQKFIDIMRDDAENYGEYDRAAGYYGKLNKLYTESKSSLQDYLGGRALPKEVPSLAQADISVNGNDITAKTELDGAVSERSVYLGGYGHFMYPKTDYDKFGNFGANSTSIGVKLYDVVTQRDPAKNWNLYEYGNVSDYFVGQTTEEKHSGNYSMKYTRSDAYGTKKTFYLRQTVDIKPGATYVFGLWAKGVNAKNCRFSGHPVIDSNYGLSQREEHDLSGTYDWKNFEFKYTAKENEYLFEILIPCSHTTQALYIDDVYVRQINSDENLVQNPGFETANDSDSEFGVYDGHIRKLVRDMNYAYENRISVNVGLGLHYMPDYIIADYPDIKDADGTYPSYMGFNPTHPKVKEMMSIFVNAAVSAIKGHPALTSLCIANEPNFQCFNTSYYEPLWQDYLKDKFSDDISALNSACNTDYTDFESIKFADVRDYTVLQNQLYRYNDTIMTEFLTFVAGKVREIAPDIKIFAKNLPAIRARGKKSLAHGIDIESLSGVFDINGCDAMHYYYHSEYPLQAKIEWYDLLTSVDDLPVFNTEDHLISDSVSMDTSDIPAETSYADIWQGAVHGRRQSVIWLWDRDKDKITNSFKNANMLLRPDIVANNGKLFLDMQRLSGELNALQNAERNVAILYSYNSMTYEPSYLNTVYRAYTGVLSLGRKPLFVTESQTEKLSGCKVLIVPEAVSVTDETYEQIVRFKQSGGKILIIGADSLSKDEFLKPRNTDDVQSGAAFIPVSETSNTEVSRIDGLSDALYTVFADAGIMDIEVKNVSDGTAAENIEYITGTYNGARLVNICNYSTEEKVISITDGGKTAENITELISGKSIGKNITLEPYKPILLRYFADESALVAEGVDGNGSIVSPSPTLKDGGVYRISAECMEKGTLYIAMYKNGKLKKIEPHRIEKGGSKCVYISHDPDEFDSVRAFLWNDGSLAPAACSAEIPKTEEAVVTDISLVGNICFIFGNNPEINGGAAITVYSDDGRLEYIDQTDSDAKGNFKFVIELSDMQKSYTARIKSGSGKEVSVLIN